ncbi:MAG TPA: hypothetical protein VHA73_07735 [Acidimicrobiales bacterium]|jgi:hypothetical protein|nr:hypothetical protein [Acidimicrobiales bacterium]
MEIDSAEKKARRRRLLIIVMVVIVAVGSWSLWGAHVAHQNRSKVSAARREAESKFKPVDVQMVATAFADRSTRGLYGMSIPGLPSLRLSTPLWLVFPTGTSMRLEVEVVGTTGRCLIVGVTGPAPNKVLTSEHRCK